MENFQLTKAYQTKKTKRILIAIHSSGYPNVLKELSLVLKKSGEYEPIFYVANENDLNLISLDSLHQEGICCLDSAGKLISSTVNSVVDTHNEISTTEKVYLQKALIKKRLSLFLKSLTQKINEVLKMLGPIAAIFYHLWHLGRRISLVRSIIRRWNISALVIGGESQFYYSPASVKAARIEQVPIINAIMFFAPGGGEVAESLAAWAPYSMQRWINKIVGSFYPHWVGESRGNRFLYLTGEEALVQEWLNMANPLPPAGESNYSDAILIECEKIREYAISNGFSQEKLIVTGEPIHDVMKNILNDANDLRKSLYKKLSLPLGKPLLLSGLAPDRISGKEDRLQNWDFRDYTELVEFWIKSLAAVKNYNVVITIHPSQKIDDLCYIEQWGVKIAHEKTSDLIPLCDIYVTDGISSTIPWAIACGKPVLEYDTFRWGPLSVDDNGGVLRTTEKAEFLSILRRLTNDTDYYAQTAARQLAVSKQWGILDGKSKERILQLFDKLTAHH